MAYHRRQEVDLLFFYILFILNQVKNKYNQKYNKNTEFYHNKKQTPTNIKQRSDKLAGYPANAQCELRELTELNNTRIRDATDLA